MKPIAFIGMPGSGKTTIAKLIADALRFDCFDGDDCVERKLNLTIPQIFERYGEAEFRAHETEVVAALCDKRNAALSLGGGAVLLNEAVISSHCTVVYLKRSLEKLYSALQEQSGQRPLTRTLEDLRRVYEARRGIYERMADITADNNGSPQRTAEYILEELRKCGYS